MLISQDKRFYYLANRVKGENTIPYQMNFIKSLMGEIEKKVLKENKREESITIEIKNPRRFQRRRMRF